MEWINIREVGPKSFKCGYCGHLVSSVKTYHTNQHSPNNLSIRICPHCEEPTFFKGESQIPGVSPGNEISHLPKDVEALYAEARAAVAANAFTAAVLASRKLLMNIAVSLKAPVGRTFIDYVEFLAQAGYIPPNGRAWVDHIRKKGNEATHEIHLMTRADAEELIVFLEMLLKFIYEFPSRVPSPTA